jgi:hypothetical protein
MSSSVLIRLTDEMADSATNPMMSSRFEVSSVVDSEAVSPELDQFRWQQTIAAEQINKAEISIAYPHKEHLCCIVGSARPSVSSSLN